MNEVFEIVEIKNACFKCDDLIMQNQCSFQIIPRHEEYENTIIFRDEYFELTSELSNVLGFDETFIYQLNFSMN